MVMSAAPDAKTEVAKPILAVNNIEVIYSHVILVLKGVSLEVPKGGIVALLGANGAGKTTTLKAISNLLHGERGEVTKDDFGQVLYNRGIINSMLGTEAIRTAMKKYGNKPMTGEQIRWGFENLNLTAERIKELGFEGMLKPIRFSCQDHQGADEARVQQWDGKAWKIISDYYRADLSILSPMVKDAAAKYAADKKITPRDCSKES